MTTHEKDRDPRTGEGQYDPKGGKTDPLRHPTPAPKPAPLPTDDCPERSEGGSCLCTPTCARCHVGPHMSVHDEQYAWMPGAAAYDHVFQLEEGAKPVEPPTTKPVPKPPPGAHPDHDLPTRKPDRADPEPKDDDDEDRRTGRGRR